MIRFPNAAKGLKMMFTAEIISIVGAVLSCIPFINIVGIIIGLVGLVLTLLGLLSAKIDESGFDQAFVFTVVNIGIGVVEIFIRDVAIISSLFSLASTVISYLIIYKVLTSTSYLLRNVGDNATANDGDTIWGLIKICLILSVVVGVISLIPLLGAIIGVIGALVELIIELVADIKYLIFLNKSGNRLSMAQG